MKNEYKPKPIDTSGVQLPRDLEPLVEVLAENVHEVWAKSRFDQEWRYGEMRDDEQKTHPCLIPYQDLAEAEKEYDRKTCVGTIKLLIKLGFKISK